MTTAAGAVLQTVALGEHFAITQTGLEVIGEPDFDQCEELWENLLTTEKTIQFAIGDAMLYFRKRWGDRADQIISDRTGYSFESLRNFEWVAEKVVPDVRRLDKLTFTHHQMVARCAPGEQKEWLKKAADTDDKPWTTAKLGTQLRVSGGAAAVSYWLMVRCETEDARQALQDRLELEGYSCKPTDDVKKAPAA